MDNPEQPELLIDIRDGLAVVTLNRPAALNALTPEMVRILSFSLKRWAQDPDVKAVVLTGAGSRAFCSGGDLKALYRVGMAHRRGESSVRAAALFFGEEYLLNRLMFHYPKPLVSFLNGLCMGGGFGLSAPCRYVLACEGSLFAMPEVGIGFFPDVGSAYFLNRLPEWAGRFLALTGSRIGAADMMQMGLATHYMPRESFETCLDRLRARLVHARTPEESEKAVAGVLDTQSEPPPNPPFTEPRTRVLGACFAQESVEGILDSLCRVRGAGACAQPWADEVIAMLLSRSPTSLKITLRHLRSMEAKTFEEVTEQDFILAQHIMQGHDLYEGIRAVLIGKDNDPQWSPCVLEDVSDSDIEDAFQPTGYGLEDVAA